MQASNSDSGELQSRLALPAPNASNDGSKKLELGAQKISLDDLGPMVVNSDGVRITGFFSRK